MGGSANTVTGDFTGRSVVVIGATGALGSAVARDLASHNAFVTMTGANANKLEALEREIAGNNSSPHVVNLRPNSEANAYTSC